MFLSFFLLFYMLLSSFTPDCFYLFFMYFYFRGNIFNTGYLMVFLGICSAFSYFLSPGPGKLPGPGKVPAKSRPKMLVSPYLVGFFSHLFYVFSEKVSSLFIFLFALLAFSSKIMTLMSLLTFIYNMIISLTSLIHFVTPNNKVSTFILNFLFSLTLVMSLFFLIAGLFSKVMVFSRFKKKVSSLLTTVLFFNIKKQPCFF